MKLKTKIIAAAALIAAIPGMAFAATDGTLGATSTGTVNVAINVQPPAATQVQVLGLDDFDFGTVQTSNTAVTAITELSDKFCLNRSDAGNVLVTLSQTGVASGNSARVQEGIDSNTDGVFETINLGVAIYDPDDSGYGFGIGTTENLVQSGPSCTAASGSGTAHTLVIAPVSLPSFNTSALTGDFSGTLTLTVSVP